MRLRDMKFREKQDMLYEKVNRRDRGESDLGIHTGRQISEASFEQEFDDSNSK